MVCMGNETAIMIRWWRPGMRTIYKSALPITMYTLSDGGYTTGGRKLMGPQILPSHVDFALHIIPCCVILWWTVHIRRVHVTKIMLIWIEFANEACKTSLEAYDHLLYSPNSCMDPRG
ncbi:hypothetical protein F5B21DRAFT_440652 [Xylaria acuta]|nr:hypothetical protein F5B21DRAFT_440652 [Xylaria acuta]